jgi:hypothetical protein
VHEAVFVRVARFRTISPGFDATLRDSVLPSIRRSGGAIGVFAGRQGPAELGARLIVSLWSSRRAAEEAEPAEEPTGLIGGPLTETTDLQLQVLPVPYWRLARPPLTSGVIRLATCRLAALDVASYTAALSAYLAPMRTEGADPADVVMAAVGEDAFVVLSTWRDWDAIEAGTGASISEPVGTRRLAELSAIGVDHFELLTDIAPVD